MCYSFKNWVPFYLSVGFFFWFSASVSAKENKKDLFSDSIMTQVFNRSEMYGKYIVEYDAMAYMKGTRSIRKKNSLFRPIADFLRLRRNWREAVFESIINIHYEAPNNFTQKIIAINGNNSDAEVIYNQSAQFFNINIYNPTSFNDEVLMPTVKKAFDYYHFYYDSTIDTLTHRIFKIRIEPKIKSQKLVSGYLYILDKSWAITEIDLKGNWDFSEFRIHTKFGFPNDDFLMPKESALSLNVKILGNNVFYRYDLYYTHSRIQKYEAITKTNPYDLSDYFNIELDSLPIIKDSIYWRDNRPIPLTEEELKIYDNSRSVHPSTKTDNFLAKYDRSWDIVKKFVTTRKFEYRSTQFRYSGLLNPLKFAYSRRDGITYWQRLKLYKEFHSGQMIYFSPDIGFVFKRKEIFFNTPLTYSFHPSKLGQLSFSIGNRNQAYNSKIIDVINEVLPDSLNFDDFNLEYYKHYYLTLSGQYELFNGFICSLGADYHIYKPVKNVEEPIPELRSTLNDDVIDLIDNQYRSFTPTIRLQWTHKQYYRINPNRGEKEYVRSNFPTLSVEYARGINGFLDGNSNYERIEADIQQHIPLGLLRSFQYYAGAGVFTNTKSVYFADFKNFTRRNFPHSWDDQIGGVFQLLDSRWYNASNNYFQFHAMYEAPFVLLHFFRNISNEIFKERFYFSQLYTHALPSYTEIGYGIGNYIFNTGVFVSLNKGRYDTFGFKFAFELGR
ncbi:MAG: DUF5686 family protein [Dysgonamonadaceae bacterium]|nr:DUF5686 family protein [Dysgonamonadaceae bacterium]